MKNIRFLVFIVVILINLILELSVFQNLEIMGVLPNLSVVLIVSYSYLRNDIEGGIFGFVSGFMEDLFIGSSLGFYSLLGFLVGFITGKFFKNMYQNNVLPVMLMVFISVLFYENAVYFFGFLFRARLDYAYYFFNIIIIEAVYSTVIAIPFFYMMYFINKAIEGIEKPKRKIFETDGDEFEI